MSGGMLWGGRFGSGPDPGLMELSVSTDVDMELLPFDLAVTKAHARSLAAAGILPAEAPSKVDKACDQILTEWEAGAITPSSEDEDVHSLVERLLTERLGGVGRSIHAGRSRNDLVATDFRLWCRTAVRTLTDDLDEAIAVLCDVAEKHTGTIMPGYTHLQRAQPVTLGFHLMAHATSLLRDRVRLSAAGKAANVSPLGAGALAGTTLPIDPALAAEELGFDGVFTNAMDAVSDRDFALDLVYASSVIGLHLSRLAEEVVLWTSSEFGFARLADEWSTGSSMMPQKRNPDLAELSRGRAGTLIGDFVALATVLKGLPLAYDRDLQEDKEVVFRSVATARRIVLACKHVVNALRFDVEVMKRAAAGAGTWATDVAEYLVGKGVPFREAHEAAGSLVARMEAEGTPIGEVSDDVLRDCHPLLTAEVRSFADPGVSVEARSNPGGPAPHRVAEQIGEIRALLNR